MHSQTRSQTPSLSLTSFLQYVILTLLAYILAGAPGSSSLSHYLSTSSTTSTSTSTTSTTRHHQQQQQQNTGNSNTQDSQQRQQRLQPNSHENGDDDDDDQHLDNTHFLFPSSPLLPTNITCPDHAYKGVYVLSREPLVVYIEGFLSQEEADRVVEVSTPSFTPSTTYTCNTATYDPLIRLSSRARLPANDTTSYCLSARALSFQGWAPNLHIEPLWAQRYGEGGHYTYHYDFSGARGARGAAQSYDGRVSSFMVYVRSNCTGGGTHFPRLEAVGDAKGKGKGKDGEWCRRGFVDCGDDKEGITFAPRALNAVFWENMRADGTGYAESLHAGLAVTSGEKIGLNIWSWYEEGLETV